jgi:two-component system, chemotaxis family, chemotaxis protein CheY
MPGKYKSKMLRRHGCAFATAVVYFLSIRFADALSWAVDIIARLFCEWCVCPWSYLMIKTLLVVDDATVMRRRIKDVARAAGWTIVGEAANGREAVDYYAKLHPVATTLDLAMPQCGGLDALRKIMEIDPDAKVLIISAMQEAKSLKAAVDLGAMDFVVKPFDDATICAALERIIAITYPKTDQMPAM